MTVKKVIYGVMAIFLTACVNATPIPSAAVDSVKTNSVVSSEVVNSAAKNSSEKSGPRLYVFDCGSLEFRNIKPASHDNNDGGHDHKADVRELFVPCYLVEHAGQRLFWDGGLPLSMVGKGNVSVMPGVTARYDRSVIDQLNDLGIQTSDIDFVAFSHMHLDHAGAGNAFFESTLLIQQSEYQHAFVNFEQSQGLSPSSYMALAKADHVILDGDYDVFGDGRVKLIAAPGHTPGHQLLWLDLDEMGPLLLSGDLYHDQKSRHERHVPSFNTDREQTLASMDKVEHFLKETGTTLWISHDPVLAKILNFSPAYYD